MTRTGLPAWQYMLERGGELDPSKLDVGLIAAAVRQSGAVLYEADCDRARSRSAVLRAIAKAVDFPMFFGGNFDALYDCLCDTLLDQKIGAVLWLKQLHSGDPALEDDAIRIREVCADAADFASENGRIFAFLIDHAGAHPPPEAGVAAAPYDEAD